MANVNANQHGSHDHHGESHGSVKSYAIGFILSIVLTIIPLVVVLQGWMTGNAAIAVIMITAIMQFLVQMLFFMHLREEKKPRYNLLALLLALVIVVTVVAGSIWIMVYNTVAH
ncbi:cytochrome o ubiquinol oxidase subunit IV [Paenibacillus sp. GCM10012307]|uniref:Cytochrome o ubiquinol oxidase subunit IV n=1 Tax=Paenibacillus roseus TaxID=2798579 RepID=A0A934MS97_9BACL|nr:cytochrome o ubiquinol oxidase subunit IV [Paenibacillus roseus]